MLDFLKRNEQNMNRIINHISDPGMQDLMLKIVEIGGEPEHENIVEWLHESRAFYRILENLSPLQSPDVLFHSHPRFILAFQDLFLVSLASHQSSYFQQRNAWQTSRAKKPYK